MKNRWIALAIIFMSFLQFTLNWFNIVPTFGSLAPEMQLTLPQVGVIVGVFIAGYGLAHIPGGMIAEAFGLRFAMLLGIAAETLGAVATAQAHSYEILLAGRFVCGVGGSIYIGSAIGLTMAWFRNHELATANGLITGVAFTVGAAIGIYAWGDVVAIYGWRMALLLGAGVGALTFVAMLFLFPVPPDAGARDIGSARLDLAALKRTLGNRDLWILGISFMGAYGSYFTVASFLPTYAAEHFRLAPQAAGSLSVILLVSGIPGGILGGWLADKVFGAIPTIVGAWIIVSLALSSIPHVEFQGLQLAAATVGCVGMMGFVVWIAMPGFYRGIRITDIPTACGLMLTIVAVGGVVIPILYGKIAVTYGYPIACASLGLISFVAGMSIFLVRRPDAGAAKYSRKVSAGSAIS